MLASTVDTWKEDGSSPCSCLWNALLPFRIHRFGCMPQTDIGTNVDSSHQLDCSTRWNTQMHAMSAPVMSAILI